MVETERLGDLFAYYEPALNVQINEIPLPEIWHNQSYFISMNNFDWFDLIIIELLNFISWELIVSFYRLLFICFHFDESRYRAIYKYRPQNSDELELEEGDVVFVLEKCDDGWFVGTSQRTGYFGTFPGNYVERIWKWLTPKCIQNEKWKHYMLNHMKHNIHTHTHITHHLIYFLFCEEKRNSFRFCFSLFSWSWAHNQKQIEFANEIYLKWKNMKRSR